MKDYNNYVHFINSKVICFDDSVFNMNDKEDVKNLMRLADELYNVPDLPKSFGENTVCVLYSDGDDTKDFTISIMHINDLPAEVQKIVRDLIHVNG